MQLANRDVKDLDAKPIDNAAIANEKTPDTAQGTTSQTDRTQSQGGESSQNPQPNTQKHSEKKQPKPGLYDLCIRYKFMKNHILRMKDIVWYQGIFNANVPNHPDWLYNIVLSNLHIIWN